MSFILLKKFMLLVYILASNEMDQYLPKPEKPKRKRNHDNKLIFCFEYLINLKIKISCGFSTSNNFKPLLWIHNNKSNVIALTRDEWIHLMAYKEYIQMRVDQCEFIDTYDALDHPTLSNISCEFKYKRGGHCYLVLSQNGHKVKIDNESWRNIVRVGIFLTTFLCWNTILQKQISHFYNTYFIPRCAELNQTSLQLSDLDTSYDKDVEVDVLRLCYEISKKMSDKIKSDIKIHKLLLRTKNK